MWLILTPTVAWVHGAEIPINFISEFNFVRRCADLSAQGNKVPREGLESIAFQSLSRYLDVTRRSVCETPSSLRSNDRPRPLPKYCAQMNRLTLVMGFPSLHAAVTASSVRPRSDILRCVSARWSRESRRLKYWLRHRTRGRGHVSFVRDVTPIWARS